MKSVLWFLPFALLCACSREGTTYGADNTGRNARDKSGETLTPTDQPETEADRSLTQTVRKALTDDSTLSMDAKNIKVIAVDGNVTLRGVVASEAEKAHIVAKVETLQGVEDCDDQLEVKAN